MCLGITYFGIWNVITNVLCAVYLCVYGFFPLKMQTTSLNIDAGWRWRLWFAITLMIPSFSGHVRLMFVGSSSSCFPALKNEEEGKHFLAEAAFHLLCNKKRKRNVTTKNVKKNKARNVIIKWWPKWQRNKLKKNTQSKLINLIATVVTITGKKKSN